MNPITLSRKVVRGLPYLAKEARYQVSCRTPLFIARPRMVHLWRHAACNARCIMCDFGFRSGDDWKALFKSPLKDEMIPRLLDQIHELGGRGTLVSYMGGEPLLCKPLLDWLDQAKRLKLDFRFTTNGYKVDQETARRLVAADLFNIGVSLESLDPSINEQIRPYPQGTAKTIAAIELLLEEKRRQGARLSVNIKCTLTQVNVESILDVVKRWGKTEGVVVTPQMFEAVDGMPETIKHKLWISDISRIEAVVRELKQMKAAGYAINADDRALDDFVRLYRNDPEHKSTIHKRTVLVEDAPACYIGVDNLFIIDGDVQLCPSYPPIGNILNNGVTLKELWFGEKAGPMREQMSKCQTLCTLSCTRRTTFLHKVRTYLKL
jgi:MoaA/NifB/PqqE/SkfB family radical SAM enzyme